MESYDLNSFPCKIRSGEMSQQEAVNMICSFIIKNYRVFNLQKFDEDFRSDLVISFLENGCKFLNSFNPDIGDFFTFLYCYINSMVNTKIRSIAQKKLKESVTVSESINNFEDKEYSYSKITHHISEIPKAPYSYSPPNINELKKIFEKINQENKDKKILVLAIKSSFYLSDSQILKVCNLYNINKEDFYKTIQYFKNQLLPKIDKRSKAIERRNFAYYHQKRYNLQLEKLNEKEIYKHSNELSSNLKYKQKKHENNWKRMNQKLDEGFLYLRPTTKSVAEVLGICERQVTYYINCAKKEYTPEKDSFN